MAQRAGRRGDGWVPWQIALGGLRRARADRPRGASCQRARRRLHGRRAGRRRPGRGSRRADPHRRRLARGRRRRRPPRPDPRRPAAPDRAARAGSCPAGVRSDARVRRTCPARLRSTHAARRRSRPLYRGGTTTQSEDTAEAWCPLARVGMGFGRGAGSGLVSICGRRVLLWIRPLAGATLAA